MDMNLLPEWDERPSCLHPGCLGDILFFQGQDSLYEVWGPEACDTYGLLHERIYDEYPAYDDVDETPCPYVEVWVP